MNMHLYPKLAWHGIIKNKKTYVPFLLTSIGLVMMFYIVSYLTYNKSVKQMRGGGDMQLILSWGVPVVALGIPTVVSSRVLGGTAEEMYVTPREIDQLINRGAKLLGMSINVCLQRHLQPRDLYTLVG